MGSSANENTSELCDDNIVLRSILKIREHFKSVNNDCCYYVVISITIGNYMYTKCFSGTTALKTHGTLSFDHFHTSNLYRKDLYLYR